MSVLRDLLAAYLAGYLVAVLVEIRRARLAAACTCHKGGRCGECLAANPDIRPKPEGGRP